MRFNLIIFFLLIFRNSYSQIVNCNINFFHYNYYLDLNKKSIENIIKLSTCPDDVNKNVEKLLQNLNGEISTLYIQELLKKNDITFKIKFNFNSIVFDHLVNLIKEKIDIDWEKNSLDELSTLENKNLVSFDNLDKISISCIDCKNEKFNTFELLTNDIETNFEKKITILSKVKQWVNGYSALNNITSTNTELSSNLFTKKKFLTESPQEPFIQMDKIKFYKLSHSINKDTILKNSDVFAKNLVQAGKSIKVLVKSNGLTIGSSAIAKDSGQINDIIDIYFSSNKKVIQGQVVDYETVMVNL